MPTFNPRGFTARVAPQPTLGLPLRAAAASWKDFRVQAGSEVSPVPNPIEDPRITSDSFASIPLRGTIDLQPELTCSLNAEELIYFVGQAAQQSANTVVVGGNVFEEEMVVGVGATSWDPYLQMQVDHQAGFAYTLFDGQVRLIGLSAEGGSIVTATIGLDFGGHHYWSDPVLEAVSTNNAQIKGLAADTMWDETTATERRIYFKVSDASGWAAGAGPLVMLAKVGAAATYGAQTFTLPTGGVWGQAFDSNIAITDSIHNLIGDSADPVLLYVPTAATPVNADEWYYDLGQASWTPSFSTAPSLGSPSANLLYAGASASIDTFDLTWNVPSIVRYGLGSRQPTSITKQGEHGGELTVSRILLDDSFLRQRRAENLVTFTMEAKSEGTFSDDYYHLVNMIAHARFTGSDPATDAAEYTDELTGSLHAYAAHSWADAPVNFQFITSIAAPAT